jgi:general secretion pathway protein A
MDLNARFNLRTPPFTREIPVANLFPLPQRAAALGNLLQCVEDRMSAALIAPAGLGKTSLLRELRDRLPEVRYAVRYVKVTDLSKRDMCREIAASLGLAPVGTYPGLVRAVQEAVERRVHDDGVRTVLILDEAHEMRPDVLGMLRLLTNFEMDSRLVLSVILAGQPPLAHLLRRPELEDLAQRLAWYGTLRPLTRDELRDYVVHRCTIAGAEASTFDDRAIEALFEMSNGNPRATDHLARRALDAAHQAGCDRVGAPHVIVARGSLQP